MIEFIPHNPGLRIRNFFGIPPGFFRPRFYEVLEMLPGDSFEIRNEEIKDLMSALSRYKLKGMLNFSSRKIDSETTLVILK